MFTHMFLGSNDTERSAKFYDAVMGTLGFVTGPHPRGRIYRSSNQALIVAQPHDGEPTHPSNGFTVGFAASGNDAIDAFHAAGILHGGSCAGKPGIRPDTPNQMYGAYLRDPDGHKICAFATV